MHLEHSPLRPDAVMLINQLEQFIATDFTSPTHDRDYPRFHSITIAGHYELASRKNSGPGSRSRRPSFLIRDRARSSGPIQSNCVSEIAVTALSDLSSSSEENRSSW